MSKILVAQTYSMPHENEEHEGTWLQWPHQYEYGIAYRNSLDATWIAMTQALVSSEKVHIIAYNASQKTRIETLLSDAGIPLTNIDFFIFPTNDVWVRDNGPIFVRDQNGALKIQDWGFNGWGGDYNFNLCNPIPSSVAAAISVPVVSLNSTMIIEGGSYELDGGGVLLATRSSILAQSNSNGAFAIRNPGMSESQAQTILSQNIGVTKFIWLDGFLSPDDVTDAHIDGFAKFVDDTKLVTMSNSDLTYWGLSTSDINTLMNASNVSNQTYEKVYLPLTQNNVVTTSSVNLGYKGSYVNYYVANNKVLVPNYNDPNDAVANAIIQTLYPGRTVVGIDCRNLYENGGMVHCVTQQQPIATATNGFNEIHKKDEGFILEQNSPNPAIEFTSINLSIEFNANCSIEIFNTKGQMVSQVIDKDLLAGDYNLMLNTSSLDAGIYYYSLKINDQILSTKKMVVAK